MKKDRYIPSPGQPSFDLQDVARVVNREADVYEYEFSSGANTITHNLRQLPRGRHIIYLTGSTYIRDTDLTTTTWSFVTSAAGTMKVIWVP